MAVFWELASLLSDTNELPTVGAVGLPSQAGTSMARANAMGRVWFMVSFKAEVAAVPRILAR
jgi:hypothetical protein